MPRTSIDATYTLPSSAGVAFATAVAADVVNGNVYTNDGVVLLKVDNAHATLAKNLTIDVPDTKNVDGLVVPSKVVAIPAVSTRLFRLRVQDYGELVAVNGETVDIKLSLIR